MKSSKKRLKECIHFPKSQMEKEHDIARKKAQPFIDNFGWPIAGVFGGTCLYSINQLIPDRPEIYFGQTTIIPFQLKN